VFNGLCAPDPCTDFALIRPRSPPTWNQHHISQLLSTPFTPFYSALSTALFRDGSYVAATPIQPVNRSNMNRPGQSPNPVSPCGLFPSFAWMGEAGSIPVLEEKIAGSSYHEQAAVRVNRLGCPHMRLRLRPAEPSVHLACHFGGCLLTQKSRSIRCWPCAVPKFFEPSPAAKSPGTKLSNGRRQGDKWQTRYTRHIPVGACEGISDNH
jgi:hypothetical protein